MIGTPSSFSVISSKPGFPGEFYYTDPDACGRSLTKKLSREKWSTHTEVLDNTVVISGINKLDVEWFAEYSKLFSEPT